jgi:predicted dehydrogenase
MERPIRWGILGTGAIARKFAADLLRLPGAELAAVGSRTTEAAERFGAEFAIPRRHGSYAGLAADPEVDVVYVATTNQLHREEALLCLDHGKAVLCEKPFALNLAEAEAMAARARHRGLFLMEAMWTRFFPAIGRLEELLQEGAIGELRQLDARFGFRAPAEPHGRLFDPALGGGALLDVGVYPVALAQLLFGREPARIAALAHHGPTGVDEQAGILCLYDRGELATLACAIRTQARNEAALYGTSGMIRLPDPFWRPEPGPGWPRAQLRIPHRRRPRRPRLRLRSRRSHALPAGRPPREPPLPPGHHPRRHAHPRPHPGMLEPRLSPAQPPGHDGSNPSRCSPFQ